jgi:hypothetical protein
MAKCANCANEALYVYRITETFQILYCQYHLPRTLSKKGTTGVSLYEAPKVVVDVPKLSKKKVEPEVVIEPEPVVDTPVEESVVTEEPVDDGAN